MRNRGNKQKTNNKIVDLNPNISIITLNVNTTKLRFSNISHFEQFGTIRFSTTLFTQKMSRLNFGS